MKLKNPLKEYRERKEEERRRKEAEKKKQQKRELTIAGVFLAVCFVILGIGALTEDSSDAGKQPNQTEIVQTTSTSDSVETAEVTTEPTETSTPTETAAPTPTETATPTPTETPVIQTISLADIPAYSGNPYVVINDNIPFFTDAEMTTTSYETYSELDSLGRCGVVHASIGLDLMPTEERGSIGQVKPTGWHTVKYNGVVEGNYLYNRCHLIGYQLTAENANTKNLITGTRYLNVEGMLPFENMTADYIKETGNHVLYRVTPMFDGDNLVANGVLMEAKSVEDNGDGVLFNVFCYNVQPNITINYATGESRLNDGVVVATDTPKQETPSTPAATEAPTESQSQASTVSYILNTNTKKFHYPSCSSVKQMNGSNKSEFTGTRDEAIAAGYSPCGRCHP